MSVNNLKLLSVNQFCELVGLSRATVYQLWKRGHGPKRTKIGRRTLISAEQAKAWLHQQERGE